LVINRLDKPYDVKAKIRLNDLVAAAMVFPHGENRAAGVLNKPQISVTPGQSAVLYFGDTVLGGGIIEKALN
jgi:tRNA-specific 2-thiouridylase